MPYVEQERRRFKYAEQVGVTPGDLNYMFTKLITEYMSSRNLSYQVINDILGALEGAKLEFYRRVAVPYEQTKMEANGDVY